MMTDKEINEAVARKLGWVRCCNPKTMENGKIIDCFGWSKGGSHFHERYPDYVTDIRAAWEIVECWQKEGFIFSLYYEPIEKNWRCAFMETVIADTAPRAICLAFLKLP
jgi:hypothetical protein